MTLRFITTDKDPEGHAVRVDNGFKGADGRSYLLLHRLPPEYSKPPAFLVELSGERVEVRTENGEAAPTYYKAFAYQDLTPVEVKFLKGQRPGKRITPFLNFSYPNVIRILGKSFDSLQENQIDQLLSQYRWKFIGGQR